MNDVFTLNVRTFVIESGASDLALSPKTYFSLVRWKLESIVLPRTYSKMEVTT